MSHDLYAADVAADFAGFAAGLTARYLTVRAGREVTPNAIHDLRMNGLAAVMSFINRASERADRYLAAFSNGDTLIARDRHINELRSIAVGNANDLATRLMTGVPNLARMLNRDAGAVGQLLTKKAEEVTLMATDRSGRRWQATTLVSVLAREFAYNVFIDSQLAVIDTDLVEIIHPDPKHPHHGTKLYKHEIGAFRHAIFHPNSQAQVRPYVPAE